MRSGSLFRIALFAMTTAVALAGPVTIDGVFSSGEWGASVKHFAPFLNGTDGAQQSVDIYWKSDDPLFVYGAIVGTPSLGSPFQSANVYVYSGSASRRQDSTQGTYGDGDDIIIESGNLWRFSQNAAPWGGAPHMLDMITPPKSTISSGTDGLVTLAYDTSTLVTEFSIARSLLGNYDVYRYGGQMFAYELSAGSDTREPGALVVGFTPEPATWSLFAIGAGLLGLAKRYRR